MQKIYRGPGQISLSSLAALKERLGAKSGAPSTSQPNNTDRGETAIPDISATTQHNAPSGSGTRAPPPTNLQIPQIPHNQPHIPQCGLAATQGGLATAPGPWLPQPRAPANSAQHPQTPKPLPGPFYNPMLEPLYYIFLEQN